MSACPIRRSIVNKFGKLLLTRILNQLFDLAPLAKDGVVVDVIVKREDSIIAQLGVKDVFRQFLILSLMTVIGWVTVIITGCAFFVTPNVGCDRLNVSQLTKLPSTTHNADTIYVIEHEQLVESGGHEELLQENGIYASL
jgi:hypothetical protein